MRWLKAPSGIVERSLPWSVLTKSQTSVHMNIKHDSDLGTNLKSPFLTHCLCFCVVN